MPLCSQTGCVLTTPRQYRPGEGIGSVVPELNTISQLSASYPSFPKVGEFAIAAVSQRYQSTHKLR